MNIIHKAVNDNGVLTVYFCVCHLISTVTECHTITPWLDFHFFLKYFNKSYFFVNKHSHVTCRMILMKYIKHDAILMNVSQAAVLTNEIYQAIWLNVSEYFTGDCLLMKYIQHYDVALTTVLQTTVFIDDIYHTWGCSIEECLAVYWWHTSSIMTLDWRTQWEHTRLRPYLTSRKDTIL